MQWGEIPCGTLYWPLGYPLLAALFMLVTHAQFGAQLASAVTGAAIAPLAYWMAIEVGEAGRGEVRSGVAAGLIVFIYNSGLSFLFQNLHKRLGPYFTTLQFVLLISQYLQSEECKLHDNLP